MPRNRVRTAAFLVAVLVLSTASVGVVAGQSNVTLTVTVVDGNGDPVSDADLSATWDGGGPVNETTRSNGQALVDVPEGANVTISVHDEDYVRNAPFEVTDASTREVEVTVSQSGSATIDVVDGQGPVADTIVQLRHDGNLIINERVDDDGSYTTRDIEQGEYELRVWKAGYLRNTTDLTVDGDVTREVRLRQGSRLLGVNVTDDHYSPPRPVADANVSVEGVVSSASTLSNGETTLQVPVNTEYEVSVSKGGYETNTTTVRVRESRENVNLTIKRTDALEIEAGQQRVVTGEPVRVTVTDEYGDPVADADVAVDGDSAGQTNDDGTASVAIDAAGDHDVTASSGDLTANTTVEGIQAGGDATTEANGTAEGNESTGTGTDLAGPGFTAVGAVVALVAAGLLLGRRE